MKILWFANSPCGSIRRFNNKLCGGGWLNSLESVIKKYPNIHLNVAFLSPSQEMPFEFDDVSYYPIYVPFSKSKIGRVFARYCSVQSLDKTLLPLMLDVVKSVKPDLIHIHGTEERFGLIREYVKDIPIVFSIQGLVSPTKEKYFSGFPKNFIRKNESLVDKLKAVSELKLYKVFKVRVQREQKYLRKAQYVIGRTFWDKAITGLFNPNRQYFVGDEILRKEFYDAGWKKENWSSPLVLVSTISPGPYKGIETLLKTASILKHNSRFPFVWKVIGLSNSDKWVKMAVKLTGISPDSCKVELCGRMTSERMAPLMQQCDIYSHVSHIENSPNSVCEAMLLGMPVIATYVGGTPSMLDNQKEGMLVQDGDPYSLASTINWLHGHFSEARVMGNNARTRALLRHDPKRIGDELVNTYSYIIYDFKQ